VVQLIEGPRLMSNIFQCPQTPEALQLDMPLEVVLEGVGGMFAASGTVIWERSTLG
jgi:hypothetical protein